MRSRPEPDISQWPLVRLVPLMPLASSMTTRPLFVWARTLPLSPPRPRLRLTAAMMSRFMDDLPVRGLADEHRPRIGGGTRADGPRHAVSINVWFAGRVSLPAVDGKTATRPFGLDPRSVAPGQPGRWRDPLRKLGVAGDPTHGKVEGHLPQRDVHPTQARAAAATS